MTFGKRRAASVPTFRSQWKTDNTGVSTSTQVKLPLVANGTYNFVVNWGDGNSDTITVWNAAATTHTYSTAGTYNITITGTITGWQFNNGGDKLKILSITEWGSLRLSVTAATQGYFYGCSNLTLSSVSDTLDLTGTTSLVEMFRGCTSLTSINNFVSWSTSAVTTFATMFYDCINFNQNISGLNTSAATTIAGLLYACSSFNNGYASGVANTLTLSTSACTNFGTVFYGNSAMNCNIGSWTVSSGTAFNNTLQGCTVFNNGGSDSIKNWVFSTTTGFSCANMFNGASAFNQPIGTWNMQKCSTISNMLANATAFDQNLGAWTLTECISFDGFMSGKTPSTFSTANLDAIYIGWTNKYMPMSRNMSFGTAKYSSAATASRALLAAAYAPITVSNATNNGGLIRITTGSNHGKVTGDKVLIYGVTGVPADGGWIITKISNTVIDLQGSTFSGAYTGLGTLHKGYAFTLTDGGL